MLETILLGKMMKINPFDQPAVELIKKETKKILSLIKFTKKYFRSTIVFFQLIILKFSGNSSKIFYLYVLILYRHFFKILLFFIILIKI